MAAAKTVFTQKGYAGTRMQEVADALEPAGDATRERLAAALDRLSTPKPMDRAIIKAERDALLLELGE